jgi:hypothetical protein
MKATVFRDVTHFSSVAIEAAFFSPLKMQAAGFSITFVPVYQAARRYTKRP